MKNSDRVLIGMGLGIIVGGVAGYFLASDEGKIARKKAKAQFQKYNDQLQTTIKEKSEVMAEKFDEASVKAKSWVDDVSSTLKSKVSSTSDTAENKIDDAQDSFKAGVEKARRDIKEKLRTIDEVVEG